MTVSSIVMREFGVILDQVRQLAFEKANRLPDSILGRLHALFGQDDTIHALTIVQGRGVTLLQSTEFSREVFKVDGSTDQKGASDHYYCFRYSNFCTCRAFLYQIISKGRAATCKHIIASRLAEATDTLSRRLEDNDTLVKILQDMGEGRARRKGPRPNHPTSWPSNPFIRHFEDRDPEDEEEEDDDDEQQKDADEKAQVKQDTVIWVKVHGIQEGSTTDDLTTPSQVTKMTEPATQSFDLLFSQSQSQRTNQSEYNM